MALINWIWYLVSKSKGKDYFTIKIPENRKRIKIKKSIFMLLMT